MSRLISSIVVSWSAVSANGKASSSSRCHGVSGPNAWPFDAMRAEYSFTRSTAMSRTALRAFDLAADQSEPPIFDSVGFSPPTYRESWSSWSVGTKSLSPG